MHSKANPLPARLPQADFSKRLLSTWSWIIGPTKSIGKRLSLSWRLDEGREKRAIEELSQFSDSELADIGLTRSDLTPEGLAIAGFKRALRQDMIVMEIAASGTARGTP